MMGRRVRIENENPTIVKFKELYLFHKYLNIEDIRIFELFVDIRLLVIFQN